MPPNTAPAHDPHPARDQALPQDATVVADAYDAIAADYADTFRGTEPEQTIELAMIDDFAATLRERAADGGVAPRVLDAGCGAGRMLPYLAARGCDVVGVDLSPGMLARARRDHPTYRTVLGSLTDLPLADGSVDGVFAWYSLIHVPDAALGGALAEAARVVRPGGSLLLACQVGRGTRDIGASLRARGHDVVLPRHHRLPDEVAAALADAGFVETARLVRAPRGAEADPQAVLAARRLGRPGDAAP